MRSVAEEFGKRFKNVPKFINSEMPTALLSNASRMKNLHGTPKVSVQQMIDIISVWHDQGGETLDKPTHFQERKGSF